MTSWVSPAQYNVVTHKGQKHHVIVVPDKDATVVNVGGNHSIRGGTLGQKCYNPDTATRERLTSPMIRVNGKLTPVSWDLATEAMADISKYILPSTASMPGRSRCIRTSISRTPTPSPSWA